ncbi:helix-turn-helix domain-containing protein [Ktedonobacter robiniae]|uniref:Helix-turn-helix domain-containing protein n=1 Tax=Ktedonobacter robiniae TaxID=2778365 RepID=A0ABQ3UIE4_9CHLR|nr:helix-turn-helix domain-containing protein [Ktedonobacter robiniae]GHO52180.1 hypothetical protein KSB_06550 [Ktedonobacter robiniae]
MEQEYYNAKEAMEILKKPSGSFYRDVREGKIPSVGKRPNMRFPKEAIDALAEVELEDEEPGLNFSVSTIAESWAKKELNRPYETEDTVPFKTVLEWRKRNNDITMNARRGKKVIGWTTFLPLDEEIAMDLVYSRIREKDIPPQAVKRWSQPQLSVYIPVIEVVPSGNIKQDKIIGAYLLTRTIKWAITLMIQYDIKNWYAVGTTPEGQAILDALGFTLLISQDEGKRKGYILENTAEHVKLITRLVEKQKALPGGKRNEQQQ